MFRTVYYYTEFTIYFFKRKFFKKLKNVRFPESSLFYIPTVLTFNNHYKNCFTESDMFFLKYILLYGTVPVMLNFEYCR